MNNAEVLLILVAINVRKDVLLKKKLGIVKQYIN